MYLWSKQRDILNSIFRNRKTAVRSCHGAGKTFVAAVAVLAFLFTRIPSKVITSAPTRYQVNDLLWSEIRHLYNTRLAPQGFPGLALATRLKVSDTHFAIGLSPREAVNFQGFHQRHVLVIRDESPGIRKEIIDGSESLMSAGDAHMLDIGNPIGTSDHFFQSFRPFPVGIPENAKFHISVFDTPNFTGEKVPSYLYRVLVNPQWEEDRREKWGVGSPLYLSKVLGEFPQESEEQLITLAECMAAVRRDIEIDPSIRPVLGVDVARYGVDKTVYTERWGLVIKRILEDTKRDTMHISNRIAAFHREREYSDILIDSIGLGAGVVDRCIEMELPAIGVNCAESASDIEQYVNLRAEMWFHGKDWLGYGKIPNHEDLIADLSAPHYEYRQKGRYQLESKDKIKKRLKRSTDYGDSYVLSIQDSESLSPRPVYQSQVITRDQLARMGVR